MSEASYTIYECDHCGHSVNTNEGNGDDGWMHAHVHEFGESFDLCPNCVGDLKKFLTAGPQHEEKRARLARQIELGSKVRTQFQRHPAGNSRFGAFIDMEP